MKISSFFAPPIFRGNEEKTLKAITLNASLWTIASLLAFAQIGVYLDEDMSIFFSIINLFFLAICFAARYALHKGWLAWTSISLLALGIIHLTSSIYALGTVRTPASITYFLIVLIAGFQFARKGVIFSTISIAFILSALIFAESNHLLPKADFSVGITQWVIYIALFGATGNLMLIAIRSIQRSLQHAQVENIARKHVEERLRIFSRAIEQNPVSIMIVNTAGLIEEVNPNFLELSGYAKEEVLGKKPSILKSDYHSDAFYENLWKTISSGKEWHGIFNNKKKNGEHYWEKASISPVLDENNKITHYVAVKEDVTEQRKAQKKQAKTNRQLQEQLKKINNLQKTLKKQALHDPLTGLHNRHYMDEMLEKEFSRAKREKHPISIVLLDLDYLKKFNDLGGHATGDHALQVFAMQLKTSLREEDTVCRHGGDEFAIILPNTSGKDALARIEELRQKTEKLPPIQRAGENLHISFTAGIATYPAQGKTSAEVITHADIALYSAKSKGRNRVELFSEKKL